MSVLTPFCGLSGSSYPMFLTLLTSPPHQRSLLTLSVLQIFDKHSYKIYDCKQILQHQPEELPAFLFLFLGYSFHILKQTTLGTLIPGTSQKVFPGFRHLYVFIHLKSDCKSVSKQRKKKNNFKCTRESSSGQPFVILWMKNNSSWTSVTVFKHYMVHVRKNKSFLYKAENITGVMCKNYEEVPFIWQFKVGLFQQDFRTSLEVTMQYNDHLHRQKKFLCAVSCLVILTACKSHYNIQM